MPAILVPSPLELADDLVPTPLHDDGSNYLNEVILGDGRAYADTAGELAAELIPGYADAEDGNARDVLRIPYAVARTTAEPLHRATRGGIGRWRLASR